MPSTFQQRVYDALRKIPRSKVTTYGLLASHLDCNSAQAIGQALKKNPFAPKVPCHRVVCSDLSIGGYSGKRNGKHIERKIALLKAEGVIFEKNKVAKSCLFDFKDLNRT